MPDIAGNVNTKIVEDLIINYQEDNTKRKATDPYKFDNEFNNRYITNTQNKQETDSTNGSYLSTLSFRAAGTNVATVARVFINNGGTKNRHGEVGMIETEFIPSRTYYREK